MRLVITIRGKLEEVYYTSQDRLLLALKRSQKRNKAINDKLDKERLTFRKKDK